MVVVVVVVVVMMVLLMSMRHPLPEVVDVEIVGPQHGSSPLSIEDLATNEVFNKIR